MIDGERVVYVLGEDGALTAAEVRLGATSDTYSEVVGGDLEEGDTIILKSAAQDSLGLVAESAQVSLTVQDLLPPEKD